MCWHVLGPSMPTASACCAPTTTGLGWSSWMPCLPTRRQPMNASAGLPSGLPRMMRRQLPTHIQDTRTCMSAEICLFLSSPACRHVVDHWSLYAALSVLVRDVYIHDIWTDHCSALMSVHGPHSHAALAGLGWHREYSPSLSLCQCSLSLATIILT